VLYNHFDLPTDIIVNNTEHNGNIKYIYDANGTKLKKTTTENGNVTTTEYSDGYIYENGNLKFINQPEGYIEPDGNDFQYVYHLKDIWGNTRITFTDNNNDGTIATSEIKREQNYYPFGMEWKGVNTTVRGVKNNLKTYQGQELTEDLGLNTHEWKYRISDRSIGRFWQIDPLAEDYMYNSTYAFQENKLGMGIELEGAELLGWDLVIGDAVQNPNGVGAHTLGITEGLVSSVQGVVDAVTSPIQTAKGIGNLAIAIASQGDVVTMIQADAALGTNSLETAGAMVDAVEQGANDLVNGNGFERGNVIGNVVGAVVGSKGTTAAVKGASAALKTTKVASQIKLIGPAGDAGASVTRQVPKSFTMKSAKKGAGTRFSDPNAPPGSNSVRVMRGNPNSPNPSQRVDYVKHTKSGQSVNVNGKPAGANTPEAHIPKDQFNINN